MCGSMVTSNLRPLKLGEEKRRKKKKETTGQKYNDQGGHKKHEIDAKRWAN